MLAMRVTATGSRKLRAYDRAIRSAAAFETAYGASGSRGSSSSHGGSDPPYASTEDATTTRSILSPTSRAARQASSTVYVPRRLASQVTYGDRRATSVTDWPARWNTARMRYSWSTRSTDS